MPLPFLFILSTSFFFYSFFLHLFFEPAPGLLLGRGSHINRAGKNDQQPAGSPQGAPQAHRVSGERVETSRSPGGCLCFVFLVPIPTGKRERKAVSERQAHPILQHKLLEPQGKPEVGLETLELYMKLRFKKEQD